MQVLSPVEAARQIDYDGPTWLDRALLARQAFHGSPAGFDTELNQALADRGRWLTQQMLAVTRVDGGVSVKPETFDLLRQREVARLAHTLSRQLNAMHVPLEPGGRVSGVYDRSITTPTGKFAVIRDQDTFTLAPWKPVLEPMRGRCVTGLIQRQRANWVIDRGRTLPGVPDGRG
jgi:hypothetical protein